MSSVRRWVFTHTDLGAAMHSFLLQFQLDGFSFQDCLVIVGVLAWPGFELVITFE
jgi:hypothetical protein